ncbi:TetR/AcrR family transcriptional regulator [Mariniluteicoccus flavus]
MVDADDATATATPNPLDEGDGARADGRALRWAQHNEARRKELVDATLRAIRLHGAGVGMDEVAAEAQTSKTVIYRHFGDRSGLYRAVAGKVERRITRQLQAALAADTEPRALIGQVTDAYLSLVEADPEVYRFVVRPPLIEGPVADAQVLDITGRVADLLGEALEPVTGPERAHTWATAIVGSVHACANRWMSDPASTTRTRLIAQLTDLAWGGLAGARPLTTDYASTPHIPNPHSERNAG